MNLIKERTLITLFLLIFAFSSSQTATVDSLRGEFTYLLQYKPNTLHGDHIIKELYTLQITDKRSFFSSENKLKFDSAFSAEYHKKGSIIDLSGIPVSRSNFLIIQTNENSQFYESVGMTLLSYTNPVIHNWKLIHETKVINAIHCKRAEVNFKGRDWIAWYSTEIPLPYGPYKFSGLPGLIVKITDKTGDYDYELVKAVPSHQLKGRTVTVNKARYQGAKLVTQKELSEARKTFRANARRELESMGTVFSQDQTRPKITETEKKGHNPIELE